MRKYLQFFLLSFSAMISSVYAQDTTSSPLTINDTIFSFVENDAALEYKILSSSQADYIISVLSKCKEIVLYCGLEDEIETYMVLCDSWKAELVNYEETTFFDSISDSWKTIKTESLSGWYEIWVLGYDLHTGDTICTPIDPYCIWFNKDDDIYNVGHYTFLDSISWTFPFNWKVPKYTIISCLEYAEELQLTYHYDIHVFGYFVPYYHMPTPPPYYKQTRSNSQPHAGHRPSPSKLTRVNLSSASSRGSDTTNMSNSSSLQQVGNQTLQKDNIPRVVDTTQRQQEEQQARLREEQQRREEQLKLQRLRKEQQRIQQQQAEQLKQQRQKEEQARQQAEQRRIQQQREEKAKQEAEQLKLKKQQEEKQQRLQPDQSKKTTQIKKKR